VLMSASEGDSVCVCVVVSVGAGVGSMVRVLVGKDVK
jgi:hypothetical protein